MKKSFAMKYFGLAKHIPCMHIRRDRKEQNLWLSQEKYTHKVLEWFHMGKAKPIYTPLFRHFMLSSKKTPTYEIKKKEMRKVTNASIVLRLMYEMVRIRQDITHTFVFFSIFLDRQGKPL